MNEQLVILEIGAFALIALVGPLVGVVIRLFLDVWTAPPRDRVVDGNAVPEGPRHFLLRFLDWISFYESMSGAGICPVYLERWTLFNRGNNAVYLHRFLGDDWALDPHDHPRRFISIGLCGWYYEDVFADPTTFIDGRFVKTETVLLKTVKHRAPWVRSFPANHLHRIRAAECGNTWTLVIVLKKSRPWGFVQDGKWVPFKNYVFGGKARKAC